MPLPDQEQTQPQPLNCTFRCKSWSNFLNLLAFDFKRKTAFVATADPPDVGTTLNLVVTLPADNRQIQLTGSIINVLQQKKAQQLHRKPGVTVALRSANPDSLSQLERLVSFAKKSVDATRPHPSLPAFETNAGQKADAASDWFDEDVHRGNTGTLPVTAELAISATEHLFKQTRYSEARAELARAAAIDPNHPRVQVLGHLIDARLALSDNNHDRATSCYRRVLAVDPAHHESRSYLTGGIEQKPTRSGLFAKIRGNR